MSFKPKNLKIGDTWQFSDGENVHSFYLQNEHPDCLENENSGAIGHAVSEDLIHWTEIRPALKRGESGDYDDLDLWTGCTIEHNGTYYLYYTSRNSHNGLANTISVATSKDLISWKKYAGNPIIIPDQKFYCCEQSPSELAVHSNIYGNLVDCRDLCVVRDEENGFWWGFFAARRHADECNQTACIGLVKSYDLLHWEQLPPCFVPQKYDCVETPDVFKMGDKWYMLCLTGNHYGNRNHTGDPNMFGCITIYAVADKAEGPYREIHDKNILIGSMVMSGFCGKTVLHKGERYIFYSQSFWRNNEFIEHSLSYPKKLVAGSDGRLYAKWYKDLENLYKENVSLTEEKANKSGRWGSKVSWLFENNRFSVSPKTDFAFNIFDTSAENFCLETNIHRKDAVSAGVIFDVSGNDIYSDNLIALVDFDQKEAWLTKARNYPKINARSLVSLNDTINLKVLAVDNVIEIYIDDCLAIHHLIDRSGGKVGLFAEKGSAEFLNTELHIIGEDK